jgi:ankyrin repeat protein
MREIFGVMVFVAAGFLSSCAVVSDLPSNVSGRAAEIFSDTKTRELAEAGARGDVRALERLLKSGVPMDGRGQFGVTPAWWAIRNRDVKGFEWLLAHGAEPNPVVESITILEMAAGYEDSAFLEIALRYKPDLNRVSDYTNSTPFNTAITYRKKRNLELLINAGVDLNQIEGGLPLVSAAQLAQYSLAYVLLKAGADPAKLNGSGVTLAQTIGSRPIIVNDEEYVWRERVMRFLKDRGIYASRPPGEGPRTQPLPDDLKG